MGLLKKKSKGGSRRSIGVGSTKKKSTNRRQKRPVEGVFRRVGHALLLTLTVPALTWSGKVLYDETMISPYLEVTEIIVEGAKRVEEREVITLAGLIEGENIFSFDTERAGERVTGHPWVESAMVERRLPGSFIISVRERVPMALIKIDDDSGPLYIMDSGGTVFKPFEASEGVELPIITGFIPVRGGGAEEGNAQGGNSIDSSAGFTEGAHVEGQLLTIMELLRDRGGDLSLEMISEVHVDPTYGISVYTLDEGVKVELGFNDFDEKILAFQRVLDEREGSLAGVESVDLDNERGVVMRFQSGALTAV